MIKTDKQKVIEYMKVREAEICKITGIKGLHFKKEDEKLINLWGEKTCKWVWEDIKYFIEILHFKGLPEKLCPFCHLYENDCNVCKYKDNHNGKCSGSNYSDYSNYYDKVKEVFKSEWYKKLILKIEKIK